MIRGGQAMSADEGNLAYVAARAYQLARTGRHEDFASIQQAIIDEGYAEIVPWLERPGVITALDEICALSRVRGPKHAMAFIDAALRLKRATETEGEPLLEF
jgi:hypothetical protein